MQRDEADNQSGGDPRELHYYFDGIALGDIGNNGTSDVDYATSIAEHRAPVATGSHAGAFNYGTVSNVLKSNVNVSTSYADFDQAYDPINGLTYQNTSSQYTVAAGDTLQSIAYQIWGDASFWYMIADANGLMGDETLSAGQVLTIPNKVHNSHNTSDVFRVYDPNEAIGNTSPTTPKPQKHHSGGCGGIGQILVAVVSIAVTIALPGIGGALGAFFQTTLGGIAAAAIGSAVGQGFAVATGIQSKFNWGAVAMAAVSAGVSAGLGEVIQGADIGSQFLRGALGSAITQGIGVATGLQKKFDWAGVAAAGVSSGVSAAVGSSTGGGFGNIAANFVGALAGAGVATLINGRDFGDNLLSVLPSVLGQTIGNAVAEGVSGPNSAQFDLPKNADKSASIGTISSPALFAAMTTTASDANVETIVVTAKRNENFWDDLGDAANFLVGFAAGAVERGGEIVMHTVNDVGDLVIGGSVDLYKLLGGDVPKGAPSAVNDVLVPAAEGVAAAAEYGVGIVTGTSDVSGDLEKYWRDRIAYPYEHGNSFGAGENLGGTAVDVVSFAVGGAGIVKGVAKAIEAGNTLSAIRAAGRAAPEAELAAEYIRLPSQLPAGFDPATPIGQFAVPPDLIPGMRHLESMRTST